MNKRFPRKRVKMRILGNKRLVSSKCDISGKNFYQNESTSIIKVRVVEGLVSLLWIDVTESRQLNFNLAIKLTLNV